MSQDLEDLEDCIGYCRVSTQRQFTDGHGLERYIDALKRYGLREDQIYWDIESGSSGDRKGYNAVLREIRTGKKRKLVIPCFDRFTRSPLQWEQARQELEQNNVTLEFLDGGVLDLVSPDSIFTSRILAAVAAQVREKNRFNSIQGHKFLRSHQKPLIACFGRKKVGDDLPPNFDQYKDFNITYFDLARELIQTFLENRTFSGTLRILCDKYGYERLNKEKHSDFPHSPNAVKTWLLHPQVRGHLVYFNKDADKRIEIKNKYDPIMSESEYLEVLRIINQKPGTRHKRYDIVNPLTGLCFCANCGSRMKHNTSRSSTGQKKTYHYMHCFGAYPFGGKPIVCDQRSNFGLTVDKVVAVVISEICKRAEVIASQVYQDSEPSQKDTPEIIQLREQIKNLEILGDKDLEEVILQKKTKLSAMEDQTRMSSRDNREHIEILETLASTPQFWQQATVSELYVVFQDLVERVECDRGEVFVSLNI